MVSKAMNSSKTPGKQGLHATCTCKPNYVPYEDGLCYRVHTQGPCPTGSMLVNSTTCVTIPCKRGRLYFPRERTCYKIGSRGPCPNGQVVLYDYSARPSIDGITYNGVCGCTSALKSSGKCREGSSADLKCEESPGMVLMDRICYKLYTQGPCSDGEWLVARRQPKGLNFWFDEVVTTNLPKAKCECKPGYSRINEVESNNLLSSAKCQPPSVGIAKFLNEQFQKGNSY